MRMLEGLALCFLLFSLMSMLLDFKKAAWLNRLPFITVFFLIAQIFIEGFRWQILPTYALAAVSLLAALARHKTIWPTKLAIQNKRTRLRRALVIVITLIALGVATALPVLVPVFSLPGTDGPYTVGTAYLNLTDTNRLEMFSQDGSAYREIFAQVWHPSDDNVHKDPIPYWEYINETHFMLTGLFRMPQFFFNHLKYVKTHSHRDIPISQAESKFPVLIFQHGYTFWINQNTPLMEHLASHGYIVVSIAHAYETCFFISRDGSVKPFYYDNEKLQLRWREVFDPEIAALYEQRKNMTDIAKEIAIKRNALELQPFMQASVREWQKDASFVIDQLQALNRAGSQSFLEGKLDLARLGAFGMSFGGAATGQLAIMDRRIRAGINLDGTQWGDVLDHPLEIPFMYFHNEPYQNTNDIYYNKAVGPVYRGYIEGTEHLNFCDFGFFSPAFKWMGLLGEIAPHRATQILNVYTRAFFDKYLKGTETNFFQGELKNYPEVHFKSRNTD